MRGALPLLLALLLTASPALAQPRAAAALDGDTLRVAGQAGTVRLAGIDAPERRGRARCPAEARLAERSAARLTQLVAGGVSLHPAPRGRDRYGRMLAEARDARGRDVGAILVAEGLAAPYAGRGPRPDWCRPGRPLP